jgi:hypothetical protein
MGGCQVLLNENETVLYPPSVADRSGLVECGKPIEGEVPYSDMAPDEQGTVKMCAEHLAFVERCRTAPRTESKPIRVLIMQGDKTLVNVEWTFTSVIPELTPAELRNAVEDGMLRATELKRARA